MFSLLKVPSEKIKDKLIKNVKERVTSINSALGREVAFDEVCDALTEGFEKSLNISLFEGQLIETEKQLADEIKKDRYTNKDWNHRR
jgi:lipoate-protein ligase A